MSDLDFAEQTLAWNYEGMIAELIRRLKRSDEMRRGAEVQCERMRKRWMEAEAKYERTRQRWLEAVRELQSSIEEHVRISAEGGRERILPRRELDEPPEP